MYSEEMDWCRRIRQAGWKVVYLPEAQVIHYVGKSSDQVVAQRHIYFQTSKVRYFRKHHGATGGGLACGSRCWPCMSWQLVLEAAKGALGHKRALRRERVRAYWQVLRSGWRPQADEMKIGLVTAEYAPMQGGVGDFTREVARALAALGHEVHVVTSPGSASLPSL